MQNFYMTPTQRALLKKNAVQSVLNRVVIRVGAYICIQFSCYCSVFV